MRRRNWKTSGRRRSHGSGSDWCEPHGAGTFYAAALRGRGHRIARAAAVLFLISLLTAPAAACGPSGTASGEAGSGTALDTEYETAETSRTVPGTADAYGSDYSAEFVGEGFSGNAVNALPFRRNALTSRVDGAGRFLEYCSFYDAAGRILIGRRDDRQGVWEVADTGFTGVTSDAHDAVSMAVDGEGYLHLAWSTHNGDLRLARSLEPGATDFEEVPAAGSRTESVTYPEFYRQPSGSLLLLYRNGRSGEADVILDRYDPQTQTWYRVSDELISGGETSPYWQACTDSRGRLHISWCWRETSDVTTNFDICYMVSEDEACERFERSDGTAQALPASRENADTIADIPQGSMLINQTSMTVDAMDRPYIVSYWRENGTVQYRVLRAPQAGSAGAVSGWEIIDTGIRTTDFTVEGRGTQALPCARPQILVRGAGSDAEIFLLLRDDEWGGRAALACLTPDGDGSDAGYSAGLIMLTSEDMGEWEPVCDVDLWRNGLGLRVFLQQEGYMQDSADMSAVGSGQESGIWILDLSMDPG